MGGAILNYGSLNITNSAFYGNTAPLNGGAIYNAGFLNITNSTFFQNFGGAIFTLGTTQIINSTFLGNSASYGGAIYASGRTIISGCTISGNTATVGGGIYDANLIGEGGLTSVGNSIIFNNASTNADIWGAGELVQTHNNLLGTSSPFVLASPTNIIGQDPLLGPLQDNGGPTITMALLPGSPALNAASSVDSYLGYALTTDQRGISRPQGNGYDMGAYEFVPPPGPTASVLSVNGSSEICNGSSTNLAVTITGGTPPYRVVYSDGANNFTVNGYANGDNIPDTPNITTTYSLVSVTDANFSAGSNNSGTPTITVRQLSTWYLDADGDTHYLGTVTSCESPGADYTATGGAIGDCDDHNNAIWQADTLYIDADGDGYDAGKERICFGATVPVGHRSTTNGTDCNDANANIKPGAVEICGNGIDDNCNGLIDENCGPCKNAINLVTTNITSCFPRFFEIEILKFYCC